MFYDPVNARRRQKFRGFLHVKWPRSDLVIKANIIDSFEMDFKTGV